MAAAWGLTYLTPTQCCSKRLSADALHCLLRQLSGQEDVSRDRRQIDWESPQVKKEPNPSLHPFPDGIWNGIFS